MRNIDEVTPFGVALKAARRETGLTRGEVSERAGVHGTTYYRYEDGSRPMVPWPVAWSIIVDADLPLECFFPPEIIIRAAARLRKGRQER